MIQSSSQEDHDKVLRMEVNTLGKKFFSLETDEKQWEEKKRFDKPENRKDSSVIRPKNMAEIHLRFL